MARAVKDRRANPGRNGPGRPRSEAADRAILGACIELLADRGLAELTLEGIARRAGSSKATIYRRWPSKLHLVADAVANLPPLPEPDTGSVARDLRIALRAFVDILARTPLSRVMPTLVGELAHDAELAALLAPLWDTRRAPLHRIVARGIGRGELRRSLDPDVAVDLLIGPLLARLFFGGGRLSRAGADRIVEHALLGIAAAPGRRTPRSRRR